MIHFQGSFVLEPDLILGDPQQGPQIDRVYGLDLINSVNFSSTKKNNMGFSF